MAEPPAVRHPWQRQKGESNRAFSAFMLYVELGHTRSLERVAQELHTSKTNVARWSARWDWVERVGAYMEHLLGERMERDLEDLTQLRQEHRARARDIGRSMQELALNGLRQLQGITDPQTGEPVNILGPGSIEKFAAAGTRVGALGVGDATDLVKGALSVSPHEVTMIARTAVDVALRYIEPERHEAFLREIEAAWGS